MNKITFAEIDKLIKHSERPLSNRALEDFQREYFGKFRHKYYRFFYHLAAEMRPKVALEIGIDHGHVMIHMAMGSRETFVVGIDRRPGCADLDLAAYAPKNASVVYKDSLSGAEGDVEKIVERYGQIGLVFQDSSHHYTESHEEFEIYSQYLAANAIWCCDDVMDIFHDPDYDPPGKSMADYFNELPGEKRLYEGLHYGSVIGVTLL